MIRYFPRSSNSTWQIRNPKSVTRFWFRISPGGSQPRRWFYSWLYTCHFGFHDPVVSNHEPAIRFHVSIPRCTRHFTSCRKVQQTSKPKNHKTLEISENELPESQRGKNLRIRRKLGFGISRPMFPQTLWINPSRSRRKSSKPRDVGTMEHRCL